MITSWNKICFTTGYIEVSVSLPGSPDAAGLWPGAWTLGNLVSERPAKRCRIWFSHIFREELAMELLQKGLGHTVMTRATLEPFLGRSIRVGSQPKSPQLAQMGDQ